MNTVKSFYKTLNITDIPWDKLVHWNGQANNIPDLFQVIESSDVSKSRMALLTIANLIESEKKIIITTPVALIFLFKLLEKQHANQDLILRILLKIAQALGSHWDTFYANDGVEQLTNVEDIWKQQHYFYTGDVEKIEDDTKLTEYLLNHAWYYSVKVFDEGKTILKAIVANDGIEQGLIYEITTIVNMIKPQKRKQFGINREWKSDRLKFIPVDEEYQKDLMVHLTPKVTQYLSFDRMDNPLFAKLFIKSSEAEQARGAALVLVIKDRITDEFLGSCGIHDINQETAELGLWLKKEAQGKGFGTEIVKKLIEITKQECFTKLILYSVETANFASQTLAEKTGFKRTFDFILEPTVLKSRMREMIQYELRLD